MENCEEAYSPKGLQLWKQFDQAGNKTAHSLNTQLAYLNNWIHIRLQFSKNNYFV